MSRPKDLQIVWVVLVGLGFWAAVWQHEMVSRYWAMIVSTVERWIHF
jgi:hypothetical protein